MLYGKWRISSAAFGISGLRWCRKYGTLSKVGLIIGSVVQMQSGVDVIGSIICCIIFRKDIPSAE